MFRLARLAPLMTTGLEILLRILPFILPFRLIATLILWLLTALLWVVLMPVRVLRRDQGPCFEGRDMVTLLQALVGSLICLFGDFSDGSGAKVESEAVRHFRNAGTNQPAPTGSGPDKSSLGGT